MRNAIVGLLFCALGAWSVLAEREVAEPGRRPFRLINLGGPELVIGNETWEAGPVSLGTGMARFENQEITLKPGVPADQATMIRSSLWNSGGNNQIVLEALGAEEVTVFLHVWEDNDPQTWSVMLNGDMVVKDYNSGSGGTWHRLGPWVAKPVDGRLTLTSVGGHANWSGLEIWPGRWDRHPLVEPLRPPTVGQIHFQKVIAPLLAKHCVECHNQNDAKGDLDLSRREGAKDVVKAGDPEGSELWLQVASDEMPKKRAPLSAEEKKLLREWLAAGAEWSAEPIDPYLATREGRAGYDWWSLQPVVIPPVPPAPDGGMIGNEIDGFIRQKLVEKNLQAAPEAEREVLARRVGFDLTGLPLDPRRVAHFVSDTEANAYEKLVDELMVSPAFGEHWARHWLDVVRFGESQGFERNRIRENAWRYRDWVIRAFNDDMPYDEFIRQQLAGDQFHPDDVSAILATGYLVSGTWDQVGHKEGSRAMQLVAREEHVEDMVGTLGQAFLGLTIQCARCHDHKFDPIPQKDYYQIAAIVGGVNQEEKERTNLKSVGTAHVPVFRQPPVFHVLKRGSVIAPGEVVSPRGLKAIRQPVSDWGLSPTSPEGERRKQFALWLSDGTHPLVARVMVNRIWHSLFGTGLVDTPSDFGFNGGRPSHPELLDWLAGTFVAEGWSVKAAVKRMVMSATYRQRSGVSHEAAIAVDPGNRLLWRAPLKRLTGEQVRDSLLVVSGSLNAKGGGPSFRDVQVKLENNHEFTVPANDFSPDFLRRTIYRLWAYSGGHPLLDGFDCPVPGVTTPKRASTITPLQALSLLHDPFAEFAAERFAERLRREKGEEVAAQMERAWQLAFGRKPKADELGDMVAFAKSHGLEQACLVLFNSNEFLFIK